jgi:hypothetical protein
LARRLLTVLGAHNHLDPAVRARDTRDRGARVQPHALARERIEHHGGAFGVLAGERLARLDHRDRAAEPAEGLGQLEPDRPRADDNEVRGRDREVEHRLVGEVRRLLESGNRRQRGRRAGGNDEASRPDLDVLAGRLRHRHRARIAKARRPCDHVHTERGKAPDGIVGRNRRDHLVDVGVNAREVDLDPSGRDAEHLPARDGMRVPRHRNQRFRRHAAAVEAVAAHLSFLDQHDRHTEGSRGRRHREPARSGPDHADVRPQWFRHVIRVPAAVSPRPERAQARQAPRAQRRAAA